MDGTELGRAAELRDERGEPSMTEAPERGLAGQPPDLCHHLGDFPTRFLDSVGLAVLARRERDSKMLGPRPDPFSLERVAQTMEALFVKLDPGRKAAAVDVDERTQLSLDPLVGPGRRSATTSGGRRRDLGRCGSSTHAAIVSPRRRRHRDFAAPTARRGAVDLRHVLEPGRLRAFPVAVGDSRRGIPRSTVTKRLRPRRPGRAAGWTALGDRPCRTRASGCPSAQAGS
jgi:hypothetical protein